MSGIDKRIQILSLILLISFLLLFLQLNNIQVRQSATLTNSKYNQINHEVVSEEPRGAILTADGTILAYSIKSNDSYKEQRVYPYGSLFSGIVGYDSIYYGLRGLEEYYNSDLETHNLPVKTFGDIFTEQPVTDDVVISANVQLQQIAQQALGNYFGAVVAIDPNTGEILAMYASPSYDPNPIVSHNISTELAAYNSLNPQSPSTALLNAAYQQRYAPGSTFKIITASAVYDLDPSLAHKSYPFLSGLPLPQSNLLLHNFGNEVCGGQLAYLLQVSCDTGFGAIGLDLGANNLSLEANKFGFNQVPPIDEPGAVASYFPAAASFAKQLPFLAYSAIGQGNVQATCLQMALAAAGVANHGVIMKPHFMVAIKNALGQTIDKYIPEPWLIASSTSTANAVTQDMELVAKAGTAYGLFNPQLNVAAKTGTAQTVGNRGSNNWLVAFGPNGPGVKPSVAVAAVVPYNPKLGSDTTGAQIAGPIVAKVLQSAIAMGL